MEPGTTAARPGRLTRPEWRGIAGMAGVVVGLHLAGWITLLAFVVPAHYALGGQVFGLGLGITAYSLGMRHAFDADHIAAIDNTTRKLMSDGRRPLSVGFWFSLGHSSVVTGMFLLLAFGVRALVGQVENSDSTLQHVTGVVGVAVSGTFLLLIGLINLGVLRGILGVWRGMRTGSYDEAALEEHLNKRGFLNRILGRTTRAVSKPWHMYPVGLLFGLGFDTTTEVSLMVLAGGAAAFALPWYAVLVLPVLFAAGMSLLDTIDGSFMNFAYGWAFSQPVRKVYYNLTVTGLSVAVALLIGGIELISILVDKLHITSGPLAAIGHLNMDNVGYAIVGLFGLTWLVAALVWRYGRIEQRWTPQSSES